MDPEAMGRSVPIRDHCRRYEVDDAPHRRAFPRFRLVISSLLMSDGIGRRPKIQGLGGKVRRGPGSLLQRFRIGLRKAHR